MSSTRDQLTPMGRGSSVETVRLSGEYDLERADELRRVLVSDTSAQIVRADMSEVSFVDSSAIGALVGVQHVLELEGRRLELTNVGLPPRRVFEIAGLLEHFGIE